MIHGFNEIPEEIRKLFEQLTKVEKLIISPILVFQNLQTYKLRLLDDYLLFHLKIYLIPKLPKDLRLLISKKGSTKSNTIFYC